MHGQLCHPGPSAGCPSVHGGMKVGDKTRQAGPCASAVTGQSVMAGGDQRFCWIPGGSDGRE